MLFTRFAGKYCGGHDIQSFTTLQAAEEALSTNIECGCIHNYACNGDEYTISEGSVLSSSNLGSCAWISVGKCWPFFQNKAMILYLHNNND